MELLEIENRAARLEALPENDKLDWYEQHLYLNLRNIYHMYRIGAMTKEIASKEKKLVLAAYNKERELQSQLAAIASECDENLKKSTDLRMAINKAPNLKDKFRLAIECIAALTGDETILQNLDVLQKEVV